MEAEAAQANELPQARLQYQPYSNMIGYKNIFVIRMTLSLLMRFFLSGVSCSPRTFVMYKRGGVHKFIF